MRVMRPAILAAAALGPALVAANVFSLSDLNWTLKNENGSIAIPGRVPSQTHLDLHAAGIITEPLLGINDFTQRWIVTDNWTYTADLGPYLKNCSDESTTLLVFYGLDTIANISVAGHQVAWVNSQFQQYVFDVTPFISKPIGDDHNLTVAFESAYLYGLNVTSRPDAEQLLTIDFEYPKVWPWIRKTQSDFGWDWGPAFVPSGIFKPAYLVTLSPNAATNHSEPASHPLLAASEGQVFIEESSLEISKVGQNTISAPDETADWNLNLTLAVRSAVAYEAPAIIVSVPELNITSDPLPVASIPANPGAATFLTQKFTIPEGVPERWYPHNLGHPKLYDFVVTLVLSDTASTSFTTRSGFRTIQLVQTRYPQEEIDARGLIPGDQWHFRVNGKAFYSMGTNTIPLDPFYSRVTSAQVRWTLESALKGGQNMLRVWGGGIYQPSDELTGGYDFYGTCDELGILTWSELIFSDSAYPINDWFLANLQPEVRQNVRRVNRHPSNVQWAAGNEIEVLLTFVRQLFPDQFQHFLDEFQTLFGEFLHDVVLDEQSSVSYTDCSTTRGVLSLDPYVLRYENGTEGEIYGNTAPDGSRWESPENLEIVVGFSRH